MRSFRNTPAAGGLAREESVAFATHRTAEGLAAYHEHGDIRLSETREDARGEIIRDYLADGDQRPDGTRVAMAHRRLDVRALNEAIRSELRDSHRLGRGEEGGERTFQTNDGKRCSHRATGSCFWRTAATSV